MNPFEKPPTHIRDVYKKYQKSSADLSKNPQVLDLTRIPSPSVLIEHVGSISSNTIVSACLEVENEVYQSSACNELLRVVTDDRPILEHRDLPGELPLTEQCYATRPASFGLFLSVNQGFLMIPELVPPRTQKALADRLLHVELSNPQHRTNVHFHHTLPYSKDESFFAQSLESAHQCVPLDPTIHKPISIQALLSQKLRWITLGCQYDWTNKRYPAGTSPSFPHGIGKFVETLFPQMKAQAAIVNLYTPGDVLNIHRDVSEESDSGLVSISIGCEALFVIGMESEAQGLPNTKDVSPLVLRLRSGDAVFMTGRSRYAWHGVPKVIPNTCPEFLEDWPGDQNEESLRHWKGWMKNKRINLNVRQMWTH